MSDQQPTPTWPRRTAAAAVAVALAAAGFAGGWFTGRPDSEAAAGTKHVARMPPGAIMPTLSDCGIQRPVARPAQITVTCADAGQIVTKIDWKYWGPTTAAAVATVTANTCDPSCADGTFEDFPAALLLDRVRVNEAGAQFTRMVLLYADRSPQYRNKAVQLVQLAVYTP